MLSELQAGIELYRPCRKEGEARIQCREQGGRRWSWDQNSIHWSDQQGERYHFSGSILESQIGSNEGIKNTSEQRKWGSA